MTVYPRSMDATSTRELRVSPYSCPDIHRLVVPASKSAALEALGLRVNHDSRLASHVAVRSVRLSNSGNRFASAVVFESRTTANSDCNIPRKTGKMTSLTIDNGYKRFF